MPLLREYFRFRLRSLLILVFVISLLLGGFAWRRDRARRQAAAVATIVQLGGRVIYDRQTVATDLGIRLVNDEPPLSDWQRRWFGRDFFYDVVDVSQSMGSPHLIGGPLPSEADRRVEPAEAQAFWRSVARFGRLRELYVYGDWARPELVRAALSNFTELRDLHIHDAKLGDEDLQGLDRLLKLERVFLEDTQVGDETARRLARCVKLHSLNLSGTRLTDEGLRHLSACRELDWLALNECKITDAGLAHLAGLTRLEYLKLEGTKITDAGLTPLAGLSRLQYLQLGGTSVTDAGLSHLSGLAQLKSLDLDATQVRGAGLIHLTGLKNLEELDLAGCPIDREGLVQISQLNRVQQLNLSNTKMSAEVFAAMTWPKGLTHLNLDRTEINDAGLQPILSLPNIENVDLLSTRVTREGHDQFWKQRPGILVWTSEAPHR